MKNLVCLSRINVVNGGNPSPATLIADSEKIRPLSILFQDNFEFLPNIILGSRTIALFINFLHGEDKTYLYILSIERNYYYANQ
jgi:hypothetical protein